MIDHEPVFYDTFWDETHPLFHIGEEYFQKFVPIHGMCKTVQGELLRAASRIHYDWFNNGWGCNNWSGAVKFIGYFFSVLPNQPSNDIHQKLKDTLDKVYEYSHGEEVNFDRDDADEWVTTITEIIVQAIIDNPTLISNNIDMFDYQD